MSGIANVMRGALLALACGTALAAGAQPPEPENNSATKIENAFRGAMQNRASASPDEALFVEKCSMCHRQMGMGTVILARRMEPAVAMLETRRLPVEFTTEVVRNGLGNMPAISRGEVSDTQLARIAKYLSKKDR
jgi:mono/diheme cytochrome c family protein